MTTLIQRLREDAEHHAEVATQCDCRPEDTLNWKHRCNALEAADEIERLTAERTWQPIETAPKERTPMIVVRGVLGSSYVTDPWCVWWQVGSWQRWPHKENPTHWMPLPALKGTP